MGTGSSYFLVFPYYAVSLLFVCSVLCTGVGFVVTSHLGGLNYGVSRGACRCFSMLGYGGAGYIYLR